MKMFTILKSISGKLVLGVPQLASIGAVGMVAVFGAYQADNTFASKERPIRSLSSISSSASYEGLQNKNGLLTSINVKDSLNQVATAEERAALEGLSGSANNFGLDNVDNIQNVSFGPAAATSETDGLGMGANKAVLAGQAGASGAGAVVPGVNAGAVSAAASQAAGTPRASLGKASVARASGNAFNAAAGAIGGSSAGAGSSASGARGGSSEGYQLSGAMPSGNNVVSSLGLSRSNSTFIAGGRDSSSARARRSFSEKNDLKEISKRSADAAGNRNRAANEGSRAFLASTRNSGGMTVEGGVETSSGGSADFENAANKKLKAIGTWTQEEDDFAEEQDKARKRLMWMAISLAVLTVAAIPLVYHLISAGKKAGLFGVSFVVWGGVIMGIVAAYALTVIGFAGNYQRNYNGAFLPVVSYLLGAASMGAMAWAAASAVTGRGKEAVQKKFMNTSISAAKKVGMFGLQKGGSELIQSAMQSDANAAAKGSKK